MSRQRRQSRAEEIGAMPAIAASPEPPGVSADAGEDDARVAVVAYQRWLERGSPDGDDQRDWFDALEALRAEQAGR